EGGGGWGARAGQQGGNRGVGLDLADLQHLAHGSAGEGRGGAVHRHELREPTRRTTLRRTRTDVPDERADDLLERQLVERGAGAGLPAAGPAGPGPLRGLGPIQRSAEQRSAGHGDGLPVVLTARASRQGWGGCDSAGRAARSRQKYFSSAVIQMRWPGSLIRSRRYSLTSIFECSIHIFQASLETFSNTFLPTSPLKGGLSRPSASRPSFTHWT